ncbi:MAG: carbonic anhydrase, partial [Rhodocyclaceae bacterium]
PAAAPAAARAPTRSATGAAAGARRGADWSFEGVTGPAHWADLRADWRLCRDGRRQSPINLVEGLDVDLAPPQFDYRPSYFRVVDTGRMLQVQVGEGLGVSVRGERYDLTHVQLHAPVSEQVDNIRAAAAVHLHHRSADGRILVVVVLLTLGPQANPFVQTVLNNLPLERGSAHSTGAALDLSSLLPFDLRHYLYVGSLVTPPCTEGVTWVVLRQAGSLSEAQHQVLIRLYPNTARPAQPAYERRVLRSR